MHTVDAESIGAGPANWEVGNELAQSTLDRPRIDLDIVGLEASVIDRRSVGHSQSGPVSGRVFPIRDSWQLTRCSDALGRLPVGVDVFAEPAAVDFRSLDDVSGITTKQCRFIVRNFRVGRQHGRIVELERRVLYIRNGAWNCLKSRPKRNSRG